MLLGSFTAVVGASLSEPYTSGTVLHTCVCNYYIRISFRVYQGTDYTETDKPSPGPLLRIHQRTDYIEFRVPRARLNTYRQVFPRYLIKGKGYK